MNPHDELQSLIDLFPDAEPLLTDAEHVASAMLPEPYRRMLAHDHHMTVTMESYHGSPVDVRILDRRLDGDYYNRKIMLVKSGTDTVVQFGIVRFDLSYVTRNVREEILAGQKPLGRVLIDHNVLRHIDLGAVLRLIAGPALARALQMPVGGITYGRLATIFCNRHAAVDLLEITAPLSPEGDGPNRMGLTPMDPEIKPRFITSRRVEFVDTDMAGIVHFTNFFRYMEQAEAEFFRSQGHSLASTKNGSGPGWPRVAASASFKAPAYHNDVLDVRIFVRRRGFKSLTLQFEFRRGETLVATGQIKTAYCRFEPGQPIQSLEIPSPVRLAAGAVRSDCGQETSGKEETKKAKHARTRRLFAPVTRERRSSFIGNQLHHDSRGRRFAG